MEAMDFWRLCDELTIMQAALLIAGEDPSQNANVEDWAVERRPPGYEAAKAALSHAVVLDVENSMFATKLVPIYERDINGNICGTIPDSVDIHNTIISVINIRYFLKCRGFTSGFFFPLGGEEKPDFLSKGSPFYASKLAAAMQAWKAVRENPQLLKGKTPKQAIEKWLREHASEYGLTKDDGNPNEQGIEEVAKVANWKPGGGVAKTPGNEA